MATHSSVLSWRIPGTGESGGLPSMGSHRVGRLKRLSSSSSSNGDVDYFGGDEKCLEANSSWLCNTECTKIQ